jgi:glycosyltransferase involved in cell wall biosynthesis
MRILFAVHQFFPVHYTGTERLALDLVHQMQRMGHSVTILTYEPNEVSGFERKGDFFINQYQFQGVLVISFRHTILPEAISFDIFHPEMEGIISETLTLGKFDIVHVFHPMRVGTVVKLAEQKKIPVVLTLTDFWLMCPKGIAVTQKGEVCLSSDNGQKCESECYADLPRDRLKCRLFQTHALIEGTAKVISATNSMKQVFEHGGLASKIIQIPFGEDYSAIVPNSKDYRNNSDIILGFMSTLTPHKGAHILIEAYNIAKQSNIALRIYGDHFGNTEYYNTLRKLANHNGNVEFCGAYKYEDMTRIYNEIDMLVIPSTWWENSPLVLSRALAHKVPAIVSNLGGMTESVQDGVNGYTFEVSNPESLAGILRKIGSDPSILNQLKARIHRPPRMEEQAFEYEKIYRDIYRGN